MVKVTNNGGPVIVVGVEFAPGTSFIEDAAFDRAKAFKVGGRGYLQAYIDMGRLKVEREEPKVEDEKPVEEKPKLRRKSKAKAKEE